MLDGADVKENSVCRYSRIMLGENENHVKTNSVSVKKRLDGARKPNEKQKTNKC